MHNNGTKHKISEYIQYIYTNIDIDIFFLSPVIDMEMQEEEKKKVEEMYQSMNKYAKQRYERKY